MSFDPVTRYLLSYEIATQQTLYVCILSNLWTNASDFISYKWTVASSDAVDRYYPLCESAILTT